MNEKVIAIDDKLTDLDLAYLYIPLSHYAMRESGQKKNAYIVAPKRFWSTMFLASCFSDVLLYDGQLETYLAGSKVVTDNFIVIDQTNDEFLQSRLKIKMSSIDRFNVYNQRMRMVRAWVHDRASAIHCRNHGVHGVVFPGMDIDMLADLFSHLHCKLNIQPICPIILGQKKPEEKIPYSHFEINVNYQRLLEIVSSARMCIGLPGPFTHLSIHLNIPTVLVMYQHEMPIKITSFWGHVKKEYCPDRRATHELLRAVDDSAWFYEYLES